MLCCKDEELLKKARYFQCNIDSDIILPGKRCTKLKKSYIIFICTFDPFSDGRHIYTFENRCLEDLSLALGDETTEIFLSTKGKKDDVDDEIKDFWHILKTALTPVRSRPPAHWSEQSIKE